MLSMHTWWLITDLTLSLVVMSLFVLDAVLIDHEGLTVMAWSLAAAIGLGIAIDSRWHHHEPGSYQAVFLSIAAVHISLALGHYHQCRRRR